VDSDILEAIDDLPEQFRLAVVLSDIEGFSYAEMAEIMDVPMGTVMSRLHRGRKALQKRLWDLARERGIVKGTLDERSKGPRGPERVDEATR
jgi:RNA polymerase sigma-70 factor, ECF subfamily